MHSFTLCFYRNSSFTGTQKPLQGELCSITPPRHSVGLSGELVMLVYIFVNDWHFTQTSHGLSEKYNVIKKSVCFQQNHFFPIPCNYSHFFFSKILYIYILYISTLTVPVQNKVLLFMLPFNACRGWSVPSTDQLIKHRDGNISRS